jgi:hypothetical protein
MAIGGKPAARALATKGHAVSGASSKTKAAVSKMVNAGFIKKGKDGSLKMTATGKKALKAGPQKDWRQ